MILFGFSIDRVGNILPTFSFSIDGIATMIPR